MEGADDSEENYHLVAFELKSAGAGTEVELSQTNRNDAEPLTAENRAEYDKNWTMVLAGLKKVAEG